jgi:hypothetical protein
LEDIRGLLGTFLSDELTSIFLSMSGSSRSLDSWPRKKKWTKIKYGSNTKKRSNDQECVEEDGSVRGSNVSSSDDEFAVRINDQIDLDERLEPDIDKNIEVSSSDLESFGTMLLSLLPDFTSSTGRLLPLFPALLSFDNGKHLLRFGDDS